MQARHVRGLTIRPLRNGDTETIAAVFARLGSASRQRRFCGDNRPVVSLLGRLAQSVDVRWNGGEREFVLDLVGPAPSAP
jgi:hypothetical protein